MEGTVTYNTEKNAPPADPALFHAIAAGNEEAFAAFYKSMVPQLTPFIFSITRSDTLVEEVIQESFLRFWLNRDKLPAINDPKAWLFRITGNICYTLFQRSLTEKKALDRVGEQVVDTHTEVTELVHLSFLKNALQQAVQQLSPQRKKIYLMSREQGMTADEIAGNLGLSTQTVRNTLTASLESLRDHLARQGYAIALLAFLVSRS